MRPVAILGIGQTKIDEMWDKSLREIGGDAAFAALQDAGMEKVDALYVGNMLSPLIDAQNQLGAYFLDWIGLWKQESVKVEAACAAELRAECDGTCNASASAQCTASCDVGACEAECEVNPGEFSCSGECSPDGGSSSHETPGYRCPACLERR